MTRIWASSRWRAITWRRSARGRDSHSALTTSGVNAIETAARLAARIRETADRLAREEPRDARFDVPYTTLQSGVIRGGIAGNVVRRDCELLFEIRNLPGDSHATHFEEIRAWAERELVPAMRRVAPEAASTSSRRSRCRRSASTRTRPSCASRKRSRARRGRASAR